jgi:hypothetical protein
VNYAISALINYFFLGVFLGLGRLCFGKDFVAAKVSKWKVVLLGLASIFVSFGSLVLVLWVASLIWNYKR